MVFGKNLAQKLFLSGALALGLIGNVSAGTINPIDWQFQGYWGGQSMVNVGGWKDEFNDRSASDGYLEARVYGPESGLTYGAEAALMNKQDLNDGKNHLVNFTLLAKTISNYCNVFSVQISDGTIRTDTNWFWVTNEPLKGTEILYMALSDGTGNDRLFSKQDWSILVDQSGTVKLYDSYDARGNLLNEVQLDKSDPWHLRLMTDAATASGFPAGDCSIKAYDYSETTVPEPSTISLIAIAGLAGAGFYSTKRK